MVEGKKKQSKLSERKPSEGTRLTSARKTHAPKRYSSSAPASSNQQDGDLSRFPKENPNPILRVSKEGVVLYANAACSMLDFINNQPGQVLPDRYLQIMADVLESGTHRQIETESRERIFTLDFVPVMDTGYIHIYGTDITRHKKTEDSLRKAHDKSEIRVKERTKDLKKARSALQT